MLIIRVHFFFLMIRRPPKSTRTDTLFPYTTLFRSQGEDQSLPLYLGARLRLAPLGLGRAEFFVQLCEGWQGRVVFHKPHSCPQPDARCLPEDRLWPKLHCRHKSEYSTRSEARLGGQEVYRTLSIRWMPYCSKK